MLYAVVDIETTGSHASSHGITEIGIVVTDGERVLERFETLVNPLQPIPPFIRALTGIDDAMVSEAPVFDAVAPKVFELLKDKVFVAHNVNFDYSFVQHHLKHAGFGLQTKKLCTVRLSRKVFPGLLGYSLGKLTRQLGVRVEGRHRAGADAIATAEILHRILDADSAGHVQAMLQSKHQEQQLPPYLSESVLDQLPSGPGVYYFHDGSGKVVYVGKANNLKKRVVGHFVGNDGSFKRQSFLRHVADVSFQPCGSELMAFILEHAEIHRLWPRFNYAQKTPVSVFSLYVFEDVRGYLRLVIDHKRRHPEPLWTFNLLVEGQAMLRKMIRTFDLCPRMCFIDRNPGPSVPEERGESPAEYNERVQMAVTYLSHALPTFAVVERGPDGRNSCILLDKGRFYGMGYLPPDATLGGVEELKPFLTLYPDHDYVRGLIYRYVQRWPAKKLDFAVPLES